MRLAKEIYWVYLEKYGATNIADIMIPLDGMYIKLEDVPNSYIEEIFGCSKEELYNNIMFEVDSSELEDNIDDL